MALQQTQLQAADQNQARVNDRQGCQKSRSAVVFLDQLVDSEAGEAWDDDGGLIVTDGISFLSSFRCIPNW